MKHNSGDIVRLAQTATWSNYGDKEPRTLEAGSIVRLESWRPEGWKTSVGRLDGWGFFYGAYSFFVWHEYLEGAETLMCAE